MGMVNSSVPGVSVGGKYIPQLGDLFFIDGKELNLIPVKGTVTATAVAAGATVEVAVDHSSQPFNFNLVPTVSTATANATVAIDPATLTLTGFSVKVTNTGAAAQDVVVSYTRNGL